MLLEFTKMHGLGNDFVVINGLEQAVELNAEQIRKIADRRFGIGCDQLLMIHPSFHEQADFLYTIFNADGAEAEHCGNGIRCVAVLLRDRGLVNKEELVAETSAGLVRSYFQDGDLVKVNMGKPAFKPADIPLSIDDQQLLYSLELDGMSVDVAALSMGNPHAVLFIENLEQAPVDEIGAQVQQHEMFPNSVNVGFAQILDNSHLRLRVFERGVGETLACGTGACAAVVAGIRVHNLDKDIDVVLKGGHLAVSWAGDGEPVWMTGPAATVYEGQINI